jgi:hypothetical protein
VDFGLLLFYWLLDIFLLISLHWGLIIESLFGYILRLLIFLLFIVSFHIFSLIITILLSAFQRIFPKGWIIFCENKFFSLYCLALEICYRKFVLYNNDQNYDRKYMKQYNGLQVNVDINFPNHQKTNYNLIYNKKKNGPGCYWYLIYIFLQKLKILF